MDSKEAIVIQGVTKNFKRKFRRTETTTLKSEVVRLLTPWNRKKRAASPAMLIPALRGVDLTIPRGRTMGIIGRNGSGKSTLLKLITGIYTPSAGSLDVRGRISALLELGAGFHPDFTGRENILINGIILGMSAREVRQRMEEIIEFSELGDFIDEPIRTYSSGMFMRLAFSVATHVDPDILIVDEILAVGDEHFGRKSMAKMMEFKSSGKTIVMVTHDLGTVEKWCDLAAWIDGGKIRLVGEPARVVNEYRDAVFRAEAQGTSLVAPALAPDGGALPELGQVPLSSGPQEERNRRWGNFDLEIQDVQILDGKGHPTAAVHPSDSVEVRLEFTCKQPLQDVVFSLALIRQDGQLVYSTTTKLDDFAVPNPLPLRGRMRFVFTPVCFREGTYTLDLSATGREGIVFDFHKGLYPFTIRADIRDAGIARPPHHWHVEALEVPMATAGGSK